VLHRGVCSLLQPTEAVGKGRRAWRPGAVKPRARQSGGGCGMNVVGTGGAVIRTVWLTSGAHTVLYFSQIIQTSSNLKIENGCLTLLQKFPIFLCG
jgi:hypothetical protein